MVILFVGLVLISTGSIIYIIELNSSNSKYEFSYDENGNVKSKQKRDSKGRFSK